MSHEKIKTAQEILNDFNAWKDAKQESFTNSLMQEFNLPGTARVSIQTRGGRKIDTIHISDRGLITDYKISYDGKVIQTKRDTLNESNVEVLESRIAEQQHISLSNYFEMHPEDCSG